MAPHHSLAVVGAVVVVGASTAEQLMLIRLRRERSERGVGSWKDLFTDLSRILSSDSGSRNREHRLAVHKKIVIVAGVGGLLILIGIG